MLLLSFPLVCHKNRYEVMLLLDTPRGGGGPDKENIPSTEHQGVVRPPASSELFQMNTYLPSEAPDNREIY